MIKAVFLSSNLLKPGSSFLGSSNGERGRKNLRRKNKRLLEPTISSLNTKCPLTEFSLRSKTEILNGHQLENLLSKSPSFCEVEECHRGRADNSGCPQNLPRPLQSDLLCSAFHTLYYIPQLLQYIYYCVDFHSKLLDSNLICCARLSPLHLHSSFFPCLGIAASNHHHLSTRFKMLAFSRICHQRKEFLDALASLRPMMDIGVFEIASIRAWNCFRLLQKY